MSFQGARPQSAPTENTRLLDSAIDEHDDEEDIRLLHESRAHHLTLAWHARPTVGLICFGVFLYFFQESVAISSMVVGIMSKICQNELTNNPELAVCANPLIQEAISDVQGQMTFIQGALSCIVSGKLGEKSDRIGRRKVLVLCAVLSLLFRIGLLYVLHPSTPYHQSWLLLVAAINGLSGGSVLTVSLTSSYVTDIVDSKSRTRSLGFIMGSFYAGMGLGPLVGSFLVRETGNPRITLWTSFFAAGLFVLLLMFVVVESRPETLRTRAQSIHLQRKASFASQRSLQSNHILSKPIWSVIDVFKPLKLLWLPRHKDLGFLPRYNVILLVIAECCVFFVSVANGPPLILFITNAYNLTSEILGYYISTVGISKTVALYILCPLIFHLLKKLFKQHSHAPDYIDYSMILFGAVSDFITPVLIIKSTSMSYIFASGIVSALGALVTPTIQSTIMKYYPESKSGEVFGAIAVMKNMLIMVGPPTGLFIYGKTLSKEPKLVFFFMAFMILMGTIAAMLLRVHDEKELSGFMKKGSQSEVNSDSESDIGTPASSVPPSPMRAYDVIRRGSAGATPRDPVSF